MSFSTLRTSLRLSHRTSGRARLRGMGPVLSLAGGALLFVSCTQGQIGGEIEVDDREGADSEVCEDLNRKEVGADEVTGLGFTAQEMFDAVSGTFETTLVWEAGTNLGEDFVTPRAGDSQLTVVVRPLLETAELIERAEREDSQSAAELDDRAYQDCPDELHMEADVTITSDNGAFDDTFRVTFTSQDAAFVRARIELTPGELEGSFDVRPEGNAKAVQTELHLVFAFGQLSGEVSGLMESRSGSGKDEAVSAASVVYGHFPEQLCEQGYPISPDSEVAVALSQEVAAHRNFDLTFEGQETTGLSLTPTLGQYCLQSGAESLALTAPVSMEVLSADGRIDGTWDLSARLELEQGAPTFLTVQREEYLSSGIPRADFEAVTGISGVVSTADQLSFSFSYNATLGADYPASGELTIIELTIPECAQEGYEPEETEDGGGSSSPGCEGSDIRETEQAVLRGSTVE